MAPEPLAKVIAGGPVADAGTHAIIARDCTVSMPDGTTRRIEPDGTIGPRFQQREWTVTVHTTSSGRHVVADDTGWLPGEYDTVPDALRAVAEHIEGRPRG